MPRDLYDCTAAELATNSVEHLQHDTAASDAATWLDQHGYDAAPIYDDDNPIGFIHTDDVTPDADSDTLDDHLTPLTIDHMISGDATFPELLDALIEQPVYFLGGHNHVNGILTRADLNTASARIYLFDRITYLEEHLRDLILDKAPNWKNTPVTGDELDDIEARYEDAKAANVALDEIHYAQFSTLETIITSVKDCWETCGFSRKMPPVLGSTKSPTSGTTSRTPTSSSKTPTATTSSPAAAQQRTSPTPSKPSPTSSHNSTMQDTIPDRQQRAAHGPAS
jgi:hypothetical protein